MQQQILALRTAIRFSVRDTLGPDEELPGFCLLKKGITPILPIYREGILNGSQVSAEEVEVIQWSGEVNYNVVHCF